MQDLTHLLEDKADISDSLERLHQLCDQWFKAKDAVEAAEEALEAAKKNFNAISQVSIPELLGQYGLSEIKLASGAKVTVTLEVSPSVKDMPAFVKFLEERGESDIVKTDLSFGKLDQSILKMITRMLAERLELYPEVKSGVHPMTLKKYVKELCGIGLKEPNERCIPLQDLPDCISAYTYNKTTIKEKK